MSTYLGTATYSPDDNKLRFYPLHRLAAEEYQRVRGAGFIWAPKQELFVAPTWTPEREDLLLELAGEIDDEDKGLVERAEERAERFEDYSEKRADDSKRAHAAVAAIADNIPLGQPILVGHRHHSERHARKDAERIHDGMRKAIRMWDTAKYWQQRAEGAIRHARYKERAEVRARRIKGIETDLRRQQKNQAATEGRLEAWQKISAMNDPEAQQKAALMVANNCHLGQRFPLADFPRDPPASQYEGEMSLWSALDGGVIDARQAAEISIASAERYLPVCRRWIEHFEHRLTYERAMLAEQGGTHLLSPKPRKVHPPILNYRAASGSIQSENRYNRGSVITYQQKEMTQAAYAKVPNDYKGCHESLDRSHRFRVAMAIFAGGPRDHSYVAVFLTDTKAHQEPTAGEMVPRPAREPRPAAPAYTSPDAAAPFDVAEMRQAVKNGVKVAVVPQLFPTPAALAARVVELADIQPGDRVLEPSAASGSNSSRWPRNGSTFRPAPSKTPGQA